MGFFGSRTQPQQANKQTTSDTHLADVEDRACQLTSAASAPAQQSLPHTSQSSSSSTADTQPSRAQSTPAGKPDKPRPGQQSQLQGLTTSQQQELQSIMRIVHLMDSAFTIPIIGRKVGLDAIIGLVPYAGDVAGGAVGTYIVSRALKYHLPKRLVLRMLMNQAIDSVVGIVPFVGDIFDIGFKANTRNAKLLQAHLEQPKQAQRADTCFLCSFFLLVVLVPMLIAVAVFGAVVLIILSVMGKL